MAALTESRWGGKLTLSTMLAASEPGYLRTRRKSLDGSVMRWRDVRAPEGTWSFFSRMPSRIFDMVLPFLRMEQNVSL